MDKYALVIFAVLVFCAGCSQNTLPDESIQIRLDTYTEIKFDSPDECYQTVPRYVKLCDTADYSFSDIGKIVISRDRIYISDIRGLKLVIFSSDGAPSGVIDFEGRGPKEFLAIGDFDVDTDENIWIVDGRKDVFFKYSADCSYMNSRKFTYDIDKVHCLKNGDFLIQMASWDVSQYAGTMLLTADTSLSVKKQLLDYPDNTDDNFGFGSCISRGDTSVFFLEPPDSHLYELGDDGELKRVYYLDYGEHAIPEKHWGNLEAFYEKNERNLYVICRAYRITDRYVTFGVTKGPRWSSAVANLETEEVSYFDHSESAFKLVGQSSEGSVWVLSEGTGFSSLPSDVQSWIQGGNTVLAIYPDR